MAAANKRSLRPFLVHMTQCPVLNPYMHTLGYRLAGCGLSDSVLGYMAWQRLGGQPASQREECVLLHIARRKLLGYVCFCVDYSVV